MKLEQKKEECIILAKKIGELCIDVHPTIIFSALTAVLQIAVNAFSPSDKEKSKLFKNDIMNVIRLAIYQEEKEQ